MSRGGGIERYDKPQRAMVPSRDGERGLGQSKGGGKDRKKEIRMRVKGGIRDRKHQRLRQVKKTQRNP
jgi:hypothetical protein